MVSGFPFGDRYAGFEVVNGMFYIGSDFMKGNPFIRVPLDAGDNAEVHVFISIGGVPFFSRVAWFFTIADPVPVYHMDFRAYPFVTVRASFLMAEPGTFHDNAAVFQAGGVAVSIIPDFFKGAFIS